MKKLLGLLGAVGLVASASGAVVSCGDNPSDKNDNNDTKDIVLAEQDGDTTVDSMTIGKATTIAISNISDYTITVGDNTTALSMKLVENKGIELSALQKSDEEQKITFKFVKKDTNTDPVTVKDEVKPFTFTINVTKISGLDLNTIKSSADIKTEEVSIDNTAENSSTDNQKVVDAVINKVSQLTNVEIKDGSDVTLFFFATWDAAFGDNSVSADISQHQTALSEKVLSTVLWNTVKAVKVVALDGSKVLEKEAGFSMSVVTKAAA